MTEGLEAASALSTVSTKKNLEDEVKPIMPLTMSEKRAIAVKKLLAAMAFIYVFYSGDFRNFVEDHELKVGEDINRKEDSVLVCSHYNVSKDLNHHNSEYDVFTSEKARAW